MPVSGRPVVHSKSVLCAIAIVVIFVAVWLLGVYVRDLLRITDPSDPRFQLADFRIEHYDSRENLEAALAVLLPVGTPRCKVEDVLITHGGAAPSADPAKFYEKIGYRSDRPKPRGSDFGDWLWYRLQRCIYDVHIAYDANSTLQEIEIRPDCTGQGPIWSVVKDDNPGVIGCGERIIGHNT